MSMHEKVSMGEVDFASWRKRKAIRDEKRKTIYRAEHRKMKRSKERGKYIYGDPQSEINKKAPMANLRQIQFLEIKQELEPFQNPSQQKTKKGAKKRGNSHFDAVMTHPSISLDFSTQQNPLQKKRESPRGRINATEIDRIERKVTEIM